MTEVSQNNHSIGRMRSSMASIYVLFLLCIVLATILPYFGKVHRFIDLISHFRLQVAIAAFIFLPLSAVCTKHRKKIFAIAALIAMLNVFELSPYYHGVGGEGVTIDSGDTLKVVMFNVYSDNCNYKRVIDWIVSQNADVAVLLEVTPKWMAELKALELEMPYVVSRPRDDNFGIAIFSRRHFVGQRVECYGEENNMDGVPTVVVDIDVGGCPVTVVGTHPLPPVRKRSVIHHRRHMDELSLELSRLDCPVVLAGDLNDTMWSPYYKDFVCKTGLSNCRKGRGVQPTWSTRLPFFCRIPIDHVLHSKHFCTLGFSRGPELGSDHLPIVGVLRLNDGGLD